MRIRSIGGLLIVGATVVAAVRYVGVFAHSEGWLISGDVWRWAVALSGLGMAVLEGVAVWYCWGAWSKAQPGTVRNVLMGMIIAMLVSVGLMVTPYIRAAMGGSLVGDVLSDLFAWAWALSVAISPLIIMAAVGLAETVFRASVPVDEAERSVSLTVTQRGPAVTGGAPLVDQVDRPALSGGIPVTLTDEQAQAVTAWDAFQGRRSLRAVAAGLGWSHTKLARVLRQAGVVTKEE